jgi:hypothetical protein
LALIGDLFLWMRDKVKPYLSSLRNVQLKEVESLFSKLESDEVPKEKFSKNKEPIKNIESFENVKSEVKVKEFKEIKEIKENKVEIKEIKEIKENKVEIKETKKEKKVEIKKVSVEILSKINTEWFEATVLIFLIKFRKVQNGISKKYALKD